MSSNIFEPRIRESSDDVSIFCCLLFVSVNLFIASFYSIYRENYALDPDYLKRIRSISVINTLLQIICFGGYWLNIYFMYESMWILWLTLSTFSIMEMGIKFGESYIILVTPNYSLKDHNKIPTKYIFCTYLFWFIGFCVDLIGTILGFLKHAHAQSICYALWECGRIVAVLFVIHILQSIRNKFKHIVIKKQNFKEEQKKIKQRSRLIKKAKKSSNKQKQRKKIKQKQVISNKQKHRNIAKKQKRSKPIPENYADDDNNDDDEDEKYGIAFSVGEPLKRIDESSDRTNSVLLTHTATNSAGSRWMINKSQSTSVTTTGSINDSLLTNTGIIMKSEIKRMTHLLYGLYVLIFVFLLNALFNGFRFSTKLGLIITQKSDDNDHRLYTDTPTWIVAAIFFPQWTAINLFVIMFSWIPRSQMTDDW